MTVIAPDRSLDTTARRFHESCLTAGPRAGQVINVLFVATVALFLLGLLAIGPIV